MREPIIEWLDQQQDNMLALLKDLVDIDSNSFDKAGVDRVGARLVSFFDAQEIPHETIPLETYGDAIRAVVSGGDGNQPILLCGHRDTVFQTGEVDKRPFSTEGGKAFGPGVADMKPGLVINAFILAAFHKFGGHPNPLVGLFTGDEEIGSPESKDVIIAEAEKARLAFNSEPSRPSGNIVTRRKGGIFCRCEITGVAAHSGGFFEDGRSAIEELARKVQALHALTDLEKGITINVGLVGGTSSSLQIKGEFYPLNPSQQSAELFDIYRGIAAQDGVAVAGDHSGGCADSGFIAAVGTPVICGVGPVGGNYHRPDEWMEIASLAERARFIAQTILKLAHQPTRSGL